MAGTYRIERLKKEEKHEVQSNESIPKSDLSHVNDVSKRGFLPAQAVAAELAENETDTTEYTVNLKNYDGSVTFDSFSVASGDTFTQADLSEMVSKKITLRPAYTFVGWSETLGDVTADYIPTVSFTIIDDTDLYAVYRPVQASDVDVTTASQLMSALDEFEEASAELGLSITDALDAPERDQEFYDYLQEYIEDRFTDEAGESVQAVNSELLSNSDESLNAQRITHAFEDATWSVGQRSDLNFSQEFVYMYTSHYIDVAEPFSGTFVGHDQTTFQNYITDLDRRTYDTYYSRGRALEVYDSMIGLVSAVADTKDRIGSYSALITKSSDSITELVNNIYTAFNDDPIDDVEAVMANVRTIAQDTYQEISELTYSNKADLFEKMDELIADVQDRVFIDMEHINELAVDGIISSVLAFAVGGGTIAILAPYISFYNEIAVTLFDQIYFVQMRMYFQTRVGERMMFAWGMSDGRN